MHKIRYFSYTKTLAASFRKIQMIEIFKTDKIPSDFLEALRLSMNYGFISKQEIWDWALKSIQSSDNYDPILLDLVKGKGPDGRQIDFALKTKTQNNNTDKSFRILISFINSQVSKQEITLEEAANKLYNYTLELEIKEPERNLLYQFDNDIYLAKSQITGDINSIKKELIETLHIYQKLSFHNYKNWSLINKEIDLRIKPAANIG